MKKTIVFFVMIALLTGTVFGLDVSAGVDGRASTNLFYVTKGSGVDETGAFGLIHKGSSYILGEPAGEGTDGWDDGLSVGFSISLDNASAGVNFVVNEDRFNDTGNLGNILKYDGWYIKGNLGIFDAQFGSDGYAGKADWDGGGFYRPFFYGDKVQGDNLDKVGGDDGFLLAIGIQPLDMLKFALGTRTNPNWTGREKAAFSTESGINASFILSLIDLADIATIDFYYGIAGGTKNGLYRVVGYDNLDNWANRFGVYSKLNFGGTFGIQFGYTADNTVFQSVAGGARGSPTEEESVRITAPFYNGIDLNVDFSGIDRVGIHFNNNFSFAAVNGPGNEVDVQLGVYRGAVGKDQRESYFVYVGELGGSYQISDPVSIGLTFTEKFGNYNWIQANAGADVAGIETISRNYFGAKVMASYTIGPVLLEAGLGFGLESYTALWVPDDGDSTLGNGNIVTFNVPIMFKVAF